MCGICGIVNFSDCSDKRALLVQMVKSIRHRGPNDSGIAASDAAWLGHTRLSIIDLSESGHQPMTTEDGRYTIVYNGELYNYQELRSCLEQMGVRFKGNSDTEVVMRSFAKWRVDAFPRWHGMFAIAIWDSLEGRLYLARDSFGIKPLYYHVDNGQLIFGSEIKAILASGRVKSELCWASLGEYLHYGTSLGERAFYRDIKKLLPGNYLCFDKNGSEIVEYASIHPKETSSDSFAEAVDKVRELLDQSVKRHLIADVPVGVFLSGGIDSAAMVACASRHYEGRISTFSAGFDFDRGVNELPRARELASHFGTDHHELHITGDNIPEVVEALVGCHDVPFGDAANIPLYLLCQQLGSDNKVIIQGDGGDEIFAGYHRYSRISNERFWRVISRSTSWIKPLLPKNSLLFRSMRTMHAFGQPDSSLVMALLMSQEQHDRLPQRVFSAEAKEQLDSESPFMRYQELYNKFKDLDPVQRMLYTDSAVILPDLYFEKVDRATMAHGIEVRVPMVDSNLARYVMSLPAEYKLHGQQKKFILRKALRGIVPDSILDGPKKGFGVPFQYWLRTSLSGYLRSVLLDQSTLSTGLFDKNSLERVIEEHVSGARDNGFLLYKLLNLSLWLNRYKVLVG